MPTTPSATSSPAPRVVAQQPDVDADFEPEIVDFEAELFEAAGIDDAPTLAGHEPAIEAAPDTSTAATPEQFTHLLAVRERLSHTEQALVEHVIKRMSPEMLMQYLGTLSAMSIDDATTFVRSLIAKSRPERVAKPR